METLKKELQEKGYTFFRMQDYPQFTEEYVKYKKYVCNSEKNLLHHIDSIRVDGAYSKSYYKSITDERYHLDEHFNSFEEIDKKITTEYLEHADTEHISQYWYYGFPHDVVEDFHSLINKIVENLYDIKSDSFQHLANLTYYKKGCFLREHRDGQTGTRICAVLLYLNDDDYKTEWGGNIVFEGKDTVEPIYGNVAILDFKEGNCLHEVKKVVDGYGRYAILDFISLGTPPERPKY
jgi:Rps23 Pro-64 3,4-dihydroxylase Tpa1-like proline 4-hydroxylase